ncbi:MAG TPA: hypothetical protein EYP86_01160 [Candidatus Altiarchaeales archaeon]|nr:hypothetical protein [Candidatus Altiarchaeales archaeon]
MKMSSKKTAKCPSCGAKWPVDTKLLKKRTLTCPECGRIDFVEYFIAKEKIVKKEESSYKPAKAFRRKGTEKEEKPHEVRITPKKKRIEPKEESELGFSLTSDCFIVTATYGTDSYKKLPLFYKFRDNVLAKNLVGIALIRIYYLISPHLSYLIRRFEILRGISRILLDFIYAILFRREEWEKEKIFIQDSTKD